MQHRTLINPCGGFNSAASFLPTSPTRCMWPDMRAFCSAFENGSLKSEVCYGN